MRTELHAKNVASCVAKNGRMVNYKTKTGRKELWSKLSSMLLGSWQWTGGLGVESRAVDRRFGGGVKGSGQEVWDGVKGSGQIRGLEVWGWGQGQWTNQGTGVFVTVAAAGISFLTARILLWSSSHF